MHIKLSPKPTSSAVLWDPFKFKTERVLRNGEHMSQASKIITQGKVLFSMCYTTINTDAQLCTKKVPKQC